MNGRKNAGFTLMELIIYVAILGVAGFLGTSILTSVSRTYLQNQARTEVTQNLRTASQIIQEAIGRATAINTTTAGYLGLAIGTSTTNFYLSDGVIYKQVDGGTALAITSSNVRVTTLNFSIISAMHALMDSVYHWAWSGGATSSIATSGIGWINFDPPGGNVRVPLGGGDFYGYAYAPNAGYIALNCVTADNCTYPYKVYSTTTGELFGWAWNETFGWISFNSTGVNTTTGVTWAVTVSTSTGDFSGWAYSENIGWISFNCNNTGIGNTCSTSDYKVKASRRTGRPVNAVQVNMVIAFSSANPLAQYSDSYNFAIALSQPSAVTVTSINPATATSTNSSFQPTIGGTNFRSGATVRLIKSGRSDIYSTGTWTVSGGGTLMSGGRFDLTVLSGEATSTWDVMVINPDGQIGISTPAARLMIVPQ